MATLNHLAAEPAAPTAFACDAMHKGLARWLRAAGYDAWWRYGVDDGELVDLARREQRVLLTSDARLMDRRPIARGEVRALFLPREFDPLQATKFVLDTLGLSVEFPRCMACGGALARLDEEAARNVIPPRTFAWLDEFFRCERCGRHFWRGTHWTRIERALAGLDR